MLWSQLERELGRDPLSGLFGDLIGTLGRHTGGFSPVDVQSDGDTARVTTDLPGVEPETIDVSVDGELLHITAERPEAQLEEGERFHRRERYFGKFDREVPLPFRVQADKVEASYEQGVLQILLPRADQDRPQKVNVNVG